MSGTEDFKPGNYRFIPGPFQYSAGVAAEAGYRIVRATFERPVALARGFDAIRAAITAANRPLTALCACELRSPGQFDDAGFIAFNKAYVRTLAEWGLFDGTTNPVARSNVCPERDGPAEPSFHAFCFTEHASDAPSAIVPPSFVIAGGAEARPGKAPYRERIVRFGDVSLEALREKSSYVLDEMERRMTLLGGDWRATTGVQVYCVHDVQTHLAGDFGRRSVNRLEWHRCRPPVVGLEFEMDCRAVADERVVKAS